MGILYLRRFSFLKTDLEVVQLVLNGDFAAFEEILNRYQTAIYRFICNNVKDQEVSKDICQEVFISAYYKLYTYKEKYKFSSWLFQIAMNKSIDYLRKNKKAQNVSLSDYEIQDTSISPEAFSEYREMKSLLEEFIRTLGEVERRILILKYSKEDLTFREIAEILKLSESTVKHKYYRIYDKYENYINNKKGVQTCYEL
jgi:RNA polymerase sigma-70 factor (ECF subfamily)